MQRIQLALLPFVPDTVVLRQIRRMQDVDG
jgi:hypothetical protein